MKKKKNPWYVWALVVAMLFAVLSIPAFMCIGKYQLCKFYFPDMNRVACFFTQLPAVTRK